MANEVWEEIHEALERAILAHETTLIFVSTRAMAERLSHHLTARLGPEIVSAHHGSMSREKRLDAETRLKDGALRALVATGSLELGIDVGSIDLVVQIGSPKSIAALLQRVGRSGHTLAGTPRGKLYPLTKDELIEAVALLDSVRRGELDNLPVPEKPLDVLAQQIVAEVACEDNTTDALYDLVRRSFIYRNLSREEFNGVIQMLVDGFTFRRGTRRSYLHFNPVTHTLRPKKGARLIATVSGGTIPDQFDYDVRLEPSGVQIGSVHEDFRRGKHPWRHLPAWQHLVADPQGGDGKGTCRRRGGPAPDDAVLARRSPGQVRRAVGVSLPHPRRGLCANQPG